MRTIALFGAGGQALHKMLALKEVRPDVRRINAYARQGGRWRYAGRLPVHVPGVWGIAFGNGLANQPTNTLFFAAGPNDEANGLYGRIDAQ